MHRQTSGIGQMAQNRPEDRVRRGGILDQKFNFFINGDNWVATWNKIKPDTYFTPFTRTTSNTTEI